jgi:hypothetical protein
VEDKKITEIFPLMPFQTVFICCLSNEGASWAFQTSVIKLEQQFFRYATILFAQVINGLDKQPSELQIRSSKVMDIN